MQKTSDEFKETKKEMISLFETLKELGINVPDKVMIEASTIQDKSKLTDFMEQQEQQQQQQQQEQMQLQLEQLKAQVELSRARAVADQGLGTERYSRIEENKALAVERRAEAQKDDQIALLNFVKAMKEIEGLDLEQLERIIGMKRMLKEQAIVEQDMTQDAIQSGSE